nr:hypothetical protein [Tanacetum cinerariifolium]
MVLIEPWIWVEHYGSSASVYVTKLATDLLVNGSSCDGIGMVIKDLNLKPKIDAMMRDFLHSSRWEKLCRETSGEIIPSRDGSRRTIKVNGFYNPKEVLKILDRVFGHKSMECTSVLHQPDGVGSQEGHIGSFGKLNGVLLALVARSGEEIDKMVDGDEDEESYASAFTDFMFNDDVDDTRYKIEPESYKEHLEHVSDDDKETEKEKVNVDIRKEKNDDINVEESIEIVKEKDIREVLDDYNKVVPDVTFKKTKEMIPQEMPRQVNLAVNKDREVNPINAKDMIAKEFATHGPKMIEGLFRKHMHNTTLNLYPTASSSSARKSSVDLQQQLYLTMKSKPQDQAADIEIWEILKSKAPHHPQQNPTTYATNLSHSQPYVLQNAYPPLTILQQPQAEFSQLDSGLDVPTFLSGDDPIACVNNAMAFLLAVFSPRYPSTNNQLRSSSNPRNQATVQDGRVTVQQVQGRQGERIPKKDKIESKPDKNRKRGEAGKSQKQLQSVEEEKQKKMQKEGPEMHNPTKFIRRKKEQGLDLQFPERYKRG